MDFNDYVKTAKSLVGNTDAEAVFEFLSSAENVTRMLMFSDLDYPALAPVAKELEDKFAGAPGFLLIGKEGANNRRSVGRMVRAILREYGYGVKKTSLEKGANLSEASDRHPIPSNLKCNHFKTAAIYGKKHPPIYKIEHNQVLA